LVRALEAERFGVAQPNLRLFISSRKTRPLQLRRKPERNLLRGKPERSPPSAQAATEPAPAQAATEAHDVAYKLRRRKRTSSPTGKERAYRGAPFGDRREASDLVDTIVERSTAEERPTRRMRTGPEWSARIAAPVA